MPTVLLVRHGHSTANGDGILAGRLPGIHLDERGRQQVATLAARLAALPVSRVVTSPLERCRETAELLVAELTGPDGTALAGQEVVDEALAECAYGGWTGRPLRELAQEPLWRVVQDQPSAARFPDSERFAAESMLEMGHRAVAAVRAHDAAVAAAAGPRSLWVAVSHGDVIKAVLADAAGSHFDHVQRFVADPGSVSVVRYGEHRPFLLASNDTGAGAARFLPPAPPAEPGTDAGILDADAVVGGGPGPSGAG